MYPLHDQVQKNIIKNYKLASKDPKRLPRLPDFVGGETDLMAGVKYLKYFPECVFFLPTGLIICRSQFVSPDSNRGVVGGSRQVFTQIEKLCHIAHELRYIFCTTTDTSKNGVSSEPRCSC